MIILSSKKKRASIAQISYKDSTLHYFHRRIFTFSNWHPLLVFIGKEQNNYHMCVFEAIHRKWDQPWNSLLIIWSLYYPFEFLPLDRSDSLPKNVFITSSIIHTTAYSSQSIISFFIASSMHCVLEYCLHRRLSFFIIPNHMSLCRFVLLLWRDWIIQLMGHL